MSDSHDSREPLDARDLPPVTPPSAGFIAQLFLVPGLIVLFIIGVWLAVNRLARSEQDWRALVIDVQSANEHIRWRGAFGLAQMLQADQDLAGETRLVRNPEVAHELAALLQSELRKHPTGSEPDGPDDAVSDDVKQQAFLARSLGLFQLPDEVLPVLQSAVMPEHHRVVRKNALEAIAVLAGRQAEAGQPLKDEQLLDQLIDLSAEPPRLREIAADPRQPDSPVEQVRDALIPQMATYILGLLPGEKSAARLELLLGHSDDAVRANAAIGLARQKSTRGLPVLAKIFTDAQQPLTAGSNAEFQQFNSLKNALHALDILRPQLSETERTEFAALLEPLAKTFREPRIRVDAEQVLLGLSK